MRMHNHKRIPTEKIPKNKKTAFYSGILSISLFGVLALPATLSAFTYDDYLLATEKTGKTIADGIIAGKNNTTALYGAAWNELASQGPTLRLPKVGPLVASYVESSNDLGQTFANTLTQGMGASHDLSQKIWNQGPTLSFPKVGPLLASYTEFSQSLGDAYTDTFVGYVSQTNAAGNAIASGIKDGFKNSANLYAGSLSKTKELVKKTPDLKLAVNTDSGVAAIADVWNSTTNYISNLWNNLTEPRSDLKAPQGQTLVPTSAPKPPKPLTPPVAPKPVATPKQPTTNNLPPTTSNPITKTPTPSPQQLVVERTVERVLSGLTSADLELKIQQLRNELVSRIGAVAGQTQSNYNNNFAAIALTNKIDQLQNTVITTPAITGGTITNASISGGTISGTTISGTTLTVSSGTFSGNLTVSGTATSTFAGDSNFDAGTLYIDSLNNRVGVGTSSPTDTFSVNGPIFLANSSPSITANRLYSSSNNLYWAGSLIGGATPGTWDTDGTHVWRPTGNVGIGTTSPYAKLSVVGEVVGSYFTATSTTATTTFNGGFAVGTGASPSGLVYDRSTRRVGIGTAAPVNKLYVNVGATLADGVVVYGTNGPMNGITNGVTSSNLGLATSNLYFSDIALVNDTVLNNTGAPSNGNLVFSAQNNTGGIKFATGVTDLNETLKVIITNGGNLGVGTTSPYAKLSVAGGGGAR